ncbi:MAG: IPT/TIG domain-containing protein [Myxococcota bacterium]|nr:IPT/TIG domain-containing protein [Myxococcota bacterium]
MNQREPKGINDAFFFVLLGLFFAGCQSSPNSSDDADSGTTVILDSFMADSSDANGTPNDTNVDVDVGDSGTVDAGMEWDELSINSLVPNRGTVAGGTEIRLIGNGFMGEISVLIRGQECRELTVESPNHLRCQTPSSTVGLAAVSVVRTGNGELRETATLDEGFTYFEDVSLDGVMPNRVPARGGAEVQLFGAGLIDGSRVRIGGNEALEVRPNEADGSLTIVVPPGIPGPADVDVSNFNGRDSLPGGIFYYEDLDVLAIEPPVGPLSGGNQVAFIGRGLLARSTVFFGMNPAEVLGANDERTNLALNAPRGAAAGAVTVTIENDNGTRELNSAYVYFDDLANNFQVAGLAPDRGPLEGGGEVWVAGNGFNETTTVQFDGRSIECELVDPNRLRCTAPPGVEGNVPVDVSTDGMNVVVPNGYTYFQRLELIAVLPDNGSVAGGTQITITGSGFSPDNTVFLGEIALEDYQVLNDTTILAVTPPNTPGPVDVIVSTDFSRSVLPGGFSYFEPAADFGGVWGNPIANTVNVTVIHGGNGQRMEDVAVVAVNEDTGFRIDGLTNDNGQLTLSDPDLSGPINVTAAKEGFEATTIEDIDVENVTIILFPNDGEGDPPPPVPAVTLRGIATGLDVLPKPVNEVYINVIVIETTHSSPYNRSRLPPPGPGGLLLEDGPFDIIARPGELAIVATAGELARDALKDYQDGVIDYWTMRRSFNPMAMGIRRFIAGSPGDIIEELDVQIDHPLDLTFPVDLDNPPAGADPGPQFYGALPRLNFGPEGFWELDTQAVGLDPNLSMRRMPRLDGWDADITYYIIGIAYSATEDNLPMAVSIEETRDVEAGLLITPFVGSTFMIDPLRGGQLGAGQEVTWGVHDGFEGPITPPSGNLILVEEPALGPPKPLWRYITPSLTTQFIMPELPEAAGGAGLGQGVMFLSVLPFLIEGADLDFDDFTYNDVAQSRWKAWSQNMIIFSR